MPYIIKTDAGTDKYPDPGCFYWNGPEIGWATGRANVYQTKDRAEKIARSLPNYENAIVLEIPL